MFKPKPGHSPEELGYNEGTLAENRARYLQHKLMSIVGQFVKLHKNIDCDWYGVELFQSQDIEGLYSMACFQEERMWIEGTTPAPASAWMVFQATAAMFPEVTTDA